MLAAGAGSTGATVRSLWTQLAKKGGTVKWMILWQQWETNLFCSEGKTGLTEPFTLRKEHRWLIDTFIRHISDRVATFMQQ